MTTSHVNNTLPKMLYCWKVHCQVEFLSTLPFKEGRGEVFFFVVFLSFSSIIFRFWGERVVMDTDQHSNDLEGINFWKRNGVNISCLKSNKTLL